MMNAIDVQGQHPAEIGFCIAIVEIEMVHALSIAVEELGMGRTAADNLYQFHLAGPERGGRDAQARRGLTLMPDGILYIDLAQFERTDAKGSAIEFHSPVDVFDDCSNRAVGGSVSTVFIEGESH